MDIETEWVGLLTLGTTIKLAMKTKNTMLSLACGLALSFGAIAAVTTSQDTVGISPSDIQKAGNLVDPGAGLVAGGTEDNLWLCEPIMIFDCSGVTKTGRTHLNISIYNNGLVNVAQFNGNGSQQNMSKLLPQDEVKRLVNSVTEAGAWTLTDAKLARRGVAMRSVTLFEGTTDAKAHTFNYFQPHGNYETIENLVTTFVGAHFTRN